MVDQTKTILLFFGIVIQGYAFGQDFAPTIQQDSVQIDFGVIEHLWIDSSCYQFVTLSVTGLPEINTSYSSTNQDTVNVSDLKHSSAQDVFGGGYGLVTLISQKQTLNPVKTIKEIVYDSISKSSRVKHTSLFLIDDFDKINKGETLIVYSRGCFGYATQSYADCNDFVARLTFDKSLLSNDFNCLIANENWYKEWVKNAPNDYWSPRINNYFGEKHKYFDTFYERIKTVPNKK